VSIGEFELISRFFASPTSGQAVAEGVALGIGDDAAILTLPAGADLVVAVDTIVAGRHFLADASPACVGHRALAVNLSDLAAMGATPAWATLALTIPSADPVWLEGFARGLWSLAGRYGVALVGGDTTGGPLTVSIQLLGHLPRGTALRRGGASSGDLLVVTGTLGDAGAGLWFAQRRANPDDVVEPKGLSARVQDAHVRELLQRFEYPTPRVEFGLAARGIASAAMDISDGLVADLPKLAEASGLAAEVAVERLPLSTALSATVSPEQARDWALGAGDDYELLLAVSPDRLGALQTAAATSGVILSTIGELRRGSGVSWTFQGREFAPAVRGYEHFR
jgi:thiamine-monophosphate kinase